MGGSVDLAKVLATLEVGVIVHDSAADIVYANAVALDLLGLTSGEMLARSSFDTRWDIVGAEGKPVIPDEQPAVRALRTKRAVRDVVLGVRRPTTQDRVWLQVSASPRFDASGEIENIVVTVNDISQERRAQSVLRAANEQLEIAVAERTDELSQAVQVLRREMEQREQVQRALVESEELYRSVLRAMSEGVVVHEPSGAIRFGNPSAEQALGLTLDQLSGRSPLDPSWRLVDERGEPLPPESIPSEITQRTGLPCRNHVLGVHRPSGERTWLSVSTDPVRIGDDEKPRAVVATFTDITAEVTAKLELEKSRATFQRVTDAVPGVLFQYQLQTAGPSRFTFWSGRAEQTLGVPPAALLEDELAFWRCIHPDDVDAARDSLAEAARELTVWERDFRLAGPGRPRWLRARAVPESKRGGVEWHGVLLDVTEEHRLADTLRHSQRMEAMGDLAAGIAHNFNNMLGAILPNLDLCLEMAPPDLVPLLNDARKATSSAAELVRQLMLVARRETDASRENVDIARVVEDVLTICRRTFDRRIQIVAHVDAGGALVSGRASDLHQVFLNLCINARDALSGIESPRLEVTVQQDFLQVFGAEPRIIVTVRDNGCGISEANLLRIGEPFFTTKGPGRGTGLGLATAYGIVREVGGSIECESRPGSGTAFHVRLPLVEVGNASRPSPSHPELPLRPGRVLVVDDEPLVRRALCRQLEDLGVYVVEATNGAEALERVRRKKGDLAAVLLDLSMPGLPGVRVLAELKSLEPALPIVVVTGSMAEPLALDEASAVLTKPVRRTDLARALQTVLGEPRIEARTAHA